MTPARGRNKPDVDRILEEYDPATFEQRQRKALAKVHEAGLIERLTPEPAGRPGARASAMGPAAPAEERPVTKPARPAARRRWPATWVVVLGCVGVMLTAMLAAVLVMTARAREAADKAAAMLSAAARAPAVTTAPIATVAPTATVAPLAAAPSTAALPPPSAQPRRSLPVKPHEPQEAPSAAVPAPQPPPTAEPAATPPQTELKF
jgi:cytoskeletal protein RodZ